MLLGLWVAPKEVSNVTAELVYGDSLNADDFLKSLRSAFSIQPAVHNSRSTSHHQAPSSRQSADFVYVRRDGHVPPLSSLYDGSYQVLKRFPKYFGLRIGEKDDTMSIDHLKPMKSSGCVTLAQPRHRGRPPRSPPTTSNQPRLHGLPPRLPRHRFSLSNKTLHLESRG